MMEKEDARINFTNENCVIKICTNRSLDGKPFYMLTCPKTPWRESINKLLLKEEQRIALNRENPYSTLYGDQIRKSPSSIIQINGGYKHKRVKKYSKMVRKIKTKRRKYKSRKRK